MRPISQFSIFPGNEPMWPLGALWRRAQFPSFYNCDCDSESDAFMCSVKSRTEQLSPCSA